MDTKTSIPGQTIPKAVRWGDLLYVSGRSSWDPRTGKVSGDSFEEQARFVLDGIVEALREGGSGPEHVLRVEGYLAGDDFDEWDRVYAEYFPPPERPARMTLAIGPTTPGLVHEVQATAGVPGGVSEKLSIGALPVGLPVQPMAKSVRWGDLLFVTGRASWYPELGKVRGETFEEQARFILGVIDESLREGGSRLEDALLVECYIANADDYDAWERLYNEYFPEPRPARTTLVTEFLVSPLGMVAEIQVTAGIRGGTNEKISIGARPGQTVPNSVRWGDLLFVSGRASDQELGTVSGDTFEEQARFVLDTVVEALREGGSAPEHVLHVDCYLADGDGFKEWDRLYAEYFPDPRPARRSVVTGYAIPPSGLLLDLKATAGIVP